MSELREQLAALAHERWTEWMKYLFEKSLDSENGSIEIPSLFVARWKRQMSTSFFDLPENEKESDRAEADKILQVIQSIDARNHIIRSAQQTKKPSSLSESKNSERTDTLEK